MLDRFPELQILANHPGVARALRSGNPHKVYRALWWGRLLGSLKDHRQLVDSLLAKRRLFLTPIKSAPGLVTFNGIGARIYGQADRDAADGSYIGTYFFTLLFLPIFPLRQYLCASSGKEYRFFGLVPFGTVAYMWRHLAAAAIVIGLAGTGFWFYESSRHNNLTVVNGLAFPIEVTVQGERLPIPPNRHATRRCGVGKLDLQARSKSGEVVDHASFELGGPPAVYVWNVGGAAFVFEQRIPYTADTKVEVPAPQVFCGQTLIRRDRVDFAFVEPPSKISLSSHEPVAWRTHLGIVPGGWQRCAAYLAYTGKGDAGLSLATSRADLDNLGDLMLMVALQRRSRGDEGALAWIDGQMGKHDNVELHRVRQDTYSAVGRKAELRPFYQRRYLANPDSPDAAYLWVRTLPQAEALAALPGLRLRWPEHHYLRLSNAWHLHMTRQFEPALALWKELRESDDDTGYEAEALVGLGRADEALALVQARPAASMERAVLGACLARQAGKALNPSWLLKLEMEPDTRTCLLEARVSGEVPKVPLGRIQDPQDRAIIEVTGLLHSDGPAALQRLRAAPAGTEGNLDSVSQLLLFGEAIHAGDQELARRLDAALPHQAYFPSAIRFVRGSGGQGDLEDLPLGVRAAAELAASRRPGLDPAAARRMREAARHDDLLGSVVTHAAARWPL